MRDIIGRPARRPISLYTNVLSIWRRIQLKNKNPRLSNRYKSLKNVCLEMYRLPAMSDNINKLLLKLGWIPFFNCFPLGAVHFQYFNTKFDNGRALLHSKEEFGACSTRII